MNANQRGFRHAELTQKIIGVFDEVYESKSTPSREGILNLHFTESLSVTQVLGVKDVTLAFDGSGYD
jgi:hypothetical protein